MFIKNYASYYEEAVDTCASHGGLVILPAEEETAEFINFMQLQLANNNFVTSPTAILRVLNLDAPSGQNWVDGLDNSPLAFSGPNGGITGYAYNQNTHGFLSKSFLFRA